MNYNCLVQTSFESASNRLRLIHTPHEALNCMTRVLFPWQQTVYASALITWLFVVETICVRRGEQGCGDQDGPMQWSILNRISTSTYHLPQLSPFTHFSSHQSLPHLNKPTQPPLTPSNSPLPQHSLPHLCHKREVQSRIGQRG